MGNSVKKNVCFLRSFVPISNLEADADVHGDQDDAAVKDASVHTLRNLNFIEYNLIQTFQNSTNKMD